MSIDNNAVDADFDRMMNGTLDALEDLPSFKPFPPGAHLVTIGWETKRVNNRNAMQLELTYVEPQELTNPDDQAPEAGDKTSVLYQFFTKDGKPNSIGQGQFKNIVASLKKTMFESMLLQEDATNAEVVAATAGMQCLAITSIRVDKKTDPNNPREYTSVDQLHLAQ